MSGHYGYQLRANIASTYGNSLTQSPRDLQTREKLDPSVKPVLKVKSDVSKMD